MMAAFGLFATFMTSCGGGKDYGADICNRLPEMQRLSMVDERPSPMCTTDANKHCTHCPATNEAPSTRGSTMHWQYRLRHLFKLRRWPVSMGQVRLLTASQRVAWPVGALGSTPFKVSAGPEEVIRVSPESSGFPSSSTGYLDEPGGAS